MTRPARVRRWGCTAGCAALLALLGPGAAGAAALPPIKHVFIVMLENQNEQDSFGAHSKAPYLAHTLRAQGAFIPGYFGIGHESLDDYVALASGQGPNPYTQADAPLYVDFIGSTGGPDGQALGQGSVYPAGVQTIADQLEAKGRTWKGYMEDMGNDPSRDGSLCGHAHPAINSQDKSQKAAAGDQYAMRHNPFVYFHSIIDNDARCKAHVVPFTQFPAALKSAAAAPSYAFITPNLCNDGHDDPCVDGKTGGLVSADSFLKKWIPKILASPGYKDGGLVIVAFDEGVDVGGGADASSCCGEVNGPNTPNNGGPTPGSGGGKVGAVLLSPYIKPGTVTKHEYNHYSLLRSVEDMFGLAHLGYAGASGPTSFGSDIFTNPKGKILPPVPRPRVRFNDVPRHGCVSRDLHVRVRTNASPPLKVTVKLDGHTVKTAHKRRFKFTVHTHSMSAGKHRLLATVVDRFGRRATRKRTFVRCAG